MSVTERFIYYWFIYGPYGSNSGQCGLRYHAAAPARAIASAGHCQELAPATLNGAEEDQRVGEAECARLQKRRKE